MSYPEPFANASAYRKMKNLEAENARLKAEVERLRKAGDWMFNAIILNSDKDIGQAMNAWNAAKEGRPNE